MPFFSYFCFDNGLKNGQNAFLTFFELRAGKCATIFLLFFVWFVSFLHHRQFI